MENKEPGDDLFDRLNVSQFYTGHILSKLMFLIKLKIDCFQHISFSNLSLIITFASNKISHIAKQFCKKDTLVNNSLEWNYI